MEKNPGGRPPIGPVRAIRISDDLWERLGRYADEHGITRSDAARLAIEALLERDQATAT